jgi:hypothetical protein
MDKKLKNEIEAIIRNHLRFFYEELLSNKQILPSGLNILASKDQNVPDGVNLLFSDCIHQEHMPLGNLPKGPVLPLAD